MTYDVLARAAAARRARWGRRLLMAGAVAALALGGYALATHPDHHRTTTPNTAAASTPPIGTTTNPPGRPDPGTAAPLPADLTQITVAGVAVPVSATAGPRQRSGGLAASFARDRAGAVLAVVNLLVRVTAQVGPDVYGPTLRTQVTGPYATALAEQVDADHQHLTAQISTGTAGTLAAQFIGYQVQLYDDDTALLKVLTEARRPDSTPLYAATVVQMAWSDNDWRLVAPAGGTWQQSMTEVAADAVAAFNPFTAGR